ncbi:helix-turn-helix domain-containing protein [Spongiactinospora sp. TRM90649]|uniref:GlxA family transcriptional regulator n=1 Tax=Spongiactinospora sp. TRM90649 TaxID=3031114 RepID=UPI0023F7E886|nr:helix-turn-helix domain-containing protein [Spongiactinospora sp. TRM90649]MDF5756226.1 helix-turn-helix domain-containing protein [Spongiactinospora sp. TRM90649]
MNAGLDRLTEADLVILLPPDNPPLSLSGDLRDALHTAHRRGAIIAGFYTSSYTLAAAGLLDGRRATTHWSLVHDFAARYPAVTVVPEVLYIDEGNILTGAGEAAGIDMCLHLVRREHGTAVANTIAREMITPPHREGDQAQYFSTPVPSSAERQLHDAMDWARANLDKRTSVSELAAHALMSPRTFARRFRAVTGTTPHAWLLAQRLKHAEELLETTDLNLEEISRLVGYNSVAVLREQFIKHRGISPRAYRQTFRRAANPPSGDLPPLKPLRRSDDPCTA